MWTKMWLILCANWERGQHSQVSFMCRAYQPLLLSVTVHGVYMCSRYWAGRRCIQLLLSVTMHSVYMCSRYWAGRRCKRCLVFISCTSICYYAQCIHVMSLFRSVLRLKCFAILDALIPLETVSTLNALFVINSVNIFLSSWCASDAHCAVTQHWWSCDWL